MRLWLAAAPIFFSAAAVADSWSFKSSEREFKFAQGHRVVVTTDASKSTQYPDFHLRIYAGEKLLAHYPGFYFQHVVASPDGKLFVGLSNDGIPGTAAAVFSQEGSLRVLAIHGVAEFDYCETSITMIRRWYDDENPNVRFDGLFEAGGITLRNCMGQQVPLLEVVTKAYNNALQRTPARSRR